jgi:hypothetical protein
MKLAMKRGRYIKVDENGLDHLGTLNGPKHPKCHLCQPYYPLIVLTGNLAFLS